jgi:protein-disulfide isomerase
MRLLPALLAAAIAVLPALAPVRAAPAQDWTHTVTMTPEGAYVLGNPKAATRLVEYVSYTCSHCAHFVAEASPPLSNGWVKRGLVSLEVRNALRDPYDLTAAILARCGGKARFFGDHEALFANQGDWMTKIEAYDAQRSAEPPTDTSAMLLDIAAKTGLSDFMAKRGLPVAQQNKCLADKASILLLTGMAKEAWEDRKIGGTPSFALNGTTVANAHDWATLSAALPALPK